MHLSTILFLLIFSVFFSNATAEDLPARTFAISENTLKHNTVIIYSGHNTIPSHVRIREGWQARLAKSKPENEKVEVYEEYLDDVRLKIDNSYDEPFIALWKKRFANIKLDMVVTVGPTADKLLNRHPELFAGVPYYFISVAGLNKDNQKFKNNIFKVVDVTSKTLPDTERLVVVAAEKGNVYHQNISESITAIASRLSPKMKIEFWSDISFDELNERAAQLPEKTALLYFPFGVDRLGERKVPFDVLKKLVKVATAPIFVHDDTYVGLGVVGGYVRNLREEGDVIGRLILGLEIPQTDEAYDEKVRGYFFDDNALKRWHIPDENLPPSSTILNRGESFFYKNRWVISFAIGLIIESILVFKLVLSLRRGKKLTKELAEERNLLEVRIIERTGELEESRLLFQDAASVAKLGVFDWNLITNDLRWDDSMFAIYGVDAKNHKLVYEFWRQMTLSDDAEKVEEALQLAIATNTALDTNFRVQRPDGKIRTIHVLAQIYRDVDDKPLRLAGVNQDITEREEAEATIRNLAYYDPLTQLANRRMLADRLKQTISSSRREHKQFSVMMMDLDKFKAVNDTLGHAAGDELLIQVAERIKACLRDNDTIARLGGDEFVVLLADIHCPQDVARVANALIETLTQPFVLTQSDNVQIGTSIGISFFPQHGDCGDMLMSKADAALYQAKDNGRGCFVYYLEERTATSTGFNTVFCASCNASLKSLD